MTPTLEQIIDLADDLRLAGFNVGTQHYVAAQNLFIALAAHGQLPEDPRHWRTLLAPLFCSMPSEQEEFYRYYDRWLERHPQLQAGPEDSNAPDSVKPGITVVRRWIKRPAVIVASCLFALILAVVLYLAYHSGTNQPKPGQGNPTPAPVGNANSGLTATPLPPILISAQPSRPAEYRYRIDWWRLLPVSLPVIIFLIWIIRGWLRRRAMLHRLTVAGNPQLNRIRLKGAEDLLFQGQTFRRAVQDMRRHREIAINELDIDETVHTTIRKGGLFTPSFGTRKASPEYLYLIDRFSPGDEQARFGEEMSRRIEAAGVFIDRYYFQGDPLTCRMRESMSTPITLSELTSRHPDHQLIIFGDGAGFMSPVTGEPERWLELFQHWPRRTLLTPEFTSDYRELALAEKNIDILPANDIGLTLLTQTAIEGTKLPVRSAVGHFPRLIIERPRRWIERHEPRPEILNQLVDQLRDYLDAEGWLWLRACAVYPLLTWEITLYLGVKLLGKSDDFEARLLSLVRLPWFRHGFMPDWLRSRLIETFTPEQEQAVRRVVEAMLSEICDTGEIQIEIAEPAPPQPQGYFERLKSKIYSLRRREKVGDLIDVQTEESPLRDVVFVDFLSGRSSNRLTVGLPEILRNVLFRGRRIHPTGLNLVSGAVILILSAILFWLIWPLKTEIISLPPVQGAGVNLEMISLSGGEFVMGSDFRMANYDFDDEKPKHRVRVSPFAIGKYEVTQAQWKAVMGADNNPSYFKGDELPVESISWDNIQEFIKRLNQKTGMQFRLPTEAEWEFAARAGTTTEYSFGDDAKLLGDYDWFSDNSDGKTHPVGTKRPNGFGLYDIHGNVWEWCSDWYGDNYYAELEKQGLVTDPQGPAAGSNRVIRGGGWSINAVYCRSAFRSGGSPGLRVVFLGFRLVRIGR